MSIIEKNKKPKPISLKKLILKPSQISESDILNHNNPLHNFNYSVPYSPKINIYETENEFQLEVDAPGLEKKDFRVRVNNKNLTVSVNKKEDCLDFKRKEFSYYSFSRSVQLPQNLLLDKLISNYTDGILYITIPKNKAIIPEKKKEITIL